MYSYDEIEDRLEKAKICGFYFEGLYLIDLLFRNRLLNVAHRLGFEDAASMPISELLAAMEKERRIQITEHSDHVLELLNEWFISKDEAISQIDTETDLLREDVVAFGHFVMPEIEEWFNEFE